MRPATDLPVIDFSAFLEGDAQHRQTLADTLRRTCQDVGFFYLKGHGLSAEILPDCFAAARHFFDLPETDKQQIAIDQSPCHRGWYKIGGEALDPATQPQGDIKEGLKIGNDLPADHPLVKRGTPLHGPNQWPHHPALHNWRPVMERGYQALCELSRQILRAIALGLGLPETHFDIWLQTPMATLSPLRYPSLQSDAGDSAISAGAHTDFGCLALLAQDEIPGLEIYQADGSWMPVPPVPDTLVVNIGDMLSLWTGGLYTSTRHRVINKSGETRHSLAFFYDPSHDTPLLPLPGCPAISDGQAPTALAHLLQKIDQSFAYHRHSRNP